MHPTPTPLLHTILLVLALAATGQGQSLIVQWGTGTDIATNARIGSPGTNTVLSLSTPANPTVGASYYPNNTDRSPVFFAGTYNTVNSSTNQLRINNNTVSGGVTNDTLSLTFDALSAVTNTSYGVVMWTRYGSGTAAAPTFGFLNGGSDSNNSITLNSLSLTAFLNSGVGSVTNRFVIQLGNSFYASAALGSLTPTNYTTLSLTNVASASWFNYDPTNDITTIGSAATLTNFSDVNAVGVFYMRSTASQFATVNYSQFSATATVVPEPSTVALLALGLGTIGLAIRRRLS